MQTPIKFPCGSDAQKCAERLVRIKRYPYARHAIRQIEGRSHHVVLVIGERLLIPSDLE